LTPGDGLDAGHADTHRPPRPPPLTAAHYRDLLTPQLAVATAGRERAASHAASRYGRGAPPSWPASRGATAGRSRRHRPARGGGRAGGPSHGANRNYTLHRIKW